MSPRAAVPNKTFDDLGLEFPLLECPIDHIPAYEPGAFCCVEQRVVAHAFRLGIGDYLRVECPACHEINYLAADTAEKARCRNCGKFVPFPPLHGHDVYVSYDALREGHAAITTDTQYGMVGWEHAEAGLTHGAPDLEVPDLETVKDEDGWVSVRLPEESFRELLTTPNYITWQGECWLFSGEKPMVYLGEWEQGDFDRYTGGFGFELIGELVPDAELAARVWAAISGPNTLTTYVFKCPDTERLALHWDYT